ncbi:hypothetical protein HY224_00570 [Candidatus Uhrbacteria bacterium]|nr:hypothetical protein [Candidatus Uhrbacteria bacterium]
MMSTQASQAPSATAEAGTAKLDPEVSNHDPLVDFVAGPLDSVFQNEEICPDCGLRVTVAVERSGHQVLRPCGFNVSRGFVLHRGAVAVDLTPEDPRKLLWRARQDALTVQGLWKPSRKTPPHGVRVASY